MKSSKYDPNVKKTLVRNYEIKVKSGQITNGAGDPNYKNAAKQTKEILLDQPSLCSSELLFNYIGEIKKAAPPPLTAQDIKESNINTKITKKLNFHINDKIYKNLVKLNISEEQKTKDKVRSTGKSRKKDLEPNINDFDQEIEEPDSLPKIPVIKPKLKSIQPTNEGKLHKLISSFEDL